MSLSFEELKRRIFENEIQQTRLRAEIKEKLTKLNLLERNRRLLVRQINRLTERVAGKLSNRDAAERAKIWATEQINRESWMEAIVEMRFENEQERWNGGRKWRQLSPTTVYLRGSAHPILTDTGMMRAAAKATVANTFKPEGEIEWNVDDIPIMYAKYHMTGTKRMPARRFFLPPSKKELVQVMKRYKELFRKKYAEYMKKAS